MFPENTKSFPGEQGHYLFFQQFYKVLEENFKFLVIFQEFQE